MSAFIVGVLAFLGGVVVGIVGMFFTDSRYLKNIQEIYESREKQLKDKIEIQKATIDSLITANNNYQIKQARKRV